MRWPIKVIIIEERDGNKVLDFDEAKRVKIENGSVIYLRKRKVVVKSIPLNYMYVTKRGKTILFLYTTDNRRFKPVKVSGEDIRIEDIDLIDLSTTLKLKDMFETKSIMEKYGNVFLTLIFMFLILAGVYFTLNKLTEIATIANNMLQATQQLVKSINATQNIY
jgi:ABC-type antimicrobial peptide transport system permease subunit